MLHAVVEILVQAAFTVCDAVTHLQHVDFAGCGHLNDMRVRLKTTRLILHDPLIMLEPISV